MTEGAEGNLTKVSHSRRVYILKNHRMNIGVKSDFYAFFKLPPEEI
jgi:hypothetical protein